MPWVVYGDLYPEVVSERSEHEWMARYLPPILVREPIAATDIARRGFVEVNIDRQPGWCDAPMVRWSRGRPWIASRHRSLARDILRQAGLTPSFVDHDGGGNLAYDRHENVRDPAMIELVSRVPTSLVRYSGRRAGADLNTLIVQLCEAFGQQRIFIVGCHETHCKALYRELLRTPWGTRSSRPLIEASVDGSLSVAPPNAITIARLGESRKLASYLEAADIVVLADARHALSELGSIIFDAGSDVASDPRDPGSLFPHCQYGGAPPLRYRRLVGFLPVAGSLAPDEHRRVFSRFGCDQITIPGPGRMLRTVRHHFIPVHDRRIAQSAPPRHPYLLAGHPHRQRLVAKLVNRLIGRDRDGLARLDIPPAMLESLVQAERIAILAPPGYTNQDLDLDLGRRAATGPSVRFVTATSLDLSALDHDDVVVRIDGGAGLGPIPADLSTSQVGPRPLQLLDFSDDVAREFRLRSVGRRDAYRAAGWLSVSEWEYPELYRYRYTHPDGEWWWRHRAAIGRYDDAQAKHDRPLNRLAATARPEHSEIDQAAQDRLARLSEQSEQDRPMKSRKSRRKNITPFDYVTERKQASKKILHGTASEIPPIHQVVATDNLLNCLRDLQNRCGDAPGPDGIRPSDYSLRDAAPMCAALSLQLLNGTYQPGPTRPVQLPKPSGGFRTLRIASVCDRIVPQAVYRAIRPAVDCQFLRCSHGFRPNYSHWDTLAGLYLAVASGNYAILNDDIRTAFDVVRHDLLLEDVARTVRADGYPELISTLIRGGDDTAAIGIHQGSALSPLLLNLNLHHRLDEPLDRGPKFPFRARYADNLVAAAGTVHEIADLRDQTVGLLNAAGYLLKGTRDTGVIDLRRVETTIEFRHPKEDGTRPTSPALLGFEIRLVRGQPDYRLTPAAWASLDEALSLTRDSDDPALHARRTIDGLIAAIGPALATRADEAIRRTHQALRRWRIAHTDATTHIQRRTEKAIEKWRNLLRARSARMHPIESSTPRGEISIWG